LLSSSVVAVAVGGGWWPLDDHANTYLGRKTDPSDPRSPHVLFGSSRVWVLVSLSKLSDDNKNNNNAAAVGALVGVLARWRCGHMMQSEDLSPEHGEKGGDRDTLTPSPVIMKETVSMIARLLDACRSAGLISTLSFRLAGLGWPERDSNAAKGRRTDK
jgi:hypothetical protein